MSMELMVKAMKTKVGNPLRRARRMATLLVVRGERSSGALAIFRFQIQHHGTLAAIETHGHDRNRILGRAKPARPIAFRRFKLDDIGAAGGQKRDQGQGKKAGHHHSFFTGDCVMGHS